MARPIRDNLLSFEHDSDAFEHPKFLALRARYGWEGEGRFWALNSMIARSPGCRLDLTTKPFVRAGIISKLGMTEADFDQFLTFLSDRSECGLVVLESGTITTERVQVELTAANRAREAERSRKGGKPVFENSQIPPENHSYPAGKPELVGRKTGFSGVPSLPVPSLPVLSGKGESSQCNELPPFSATPSDEEEATPMIPDLMEIHRRITGASLAINEQDMTRLLALFRRHDGHTIVSAYRLCQEEKPGKAFRFFLEDFPGYLARIRAAPDSGRCPECGVRLDLGYLHLKTCSSREPAQPEKQPESSAEQAGDVTAQSEPPPLDDSFPDDIPEPAAKVELDIF